MGHGKLRQQSAREFRGGRPPRRREPRGTHTAGWVGRAGYVYFIGMPDDGSKRPTLGSRLEFLQIGNPHPLRILAIIASRFEGERCLHYKLRECRLQGEWFARSRYLNRLLARLEQRTVRAQSRKAA